MSKYITFLILLLVFSWSFAKMNEVERIRSHLSLVHELLKLRPISQLDPSQKENRQKSLQALRNYYEAEQFPENIGHPDSRHPYFIDQKGVPCAVGYLIIQSGHSGLAMRISEQMNTLYLDQMEDPELNSWIAHSGFTLDELRLIQPGYAYEKKYQDPFVEAAFTGDIDTINAYLKKGLETFQNHSKSQRLNDALRAVAPVIYVSKPKLDRNADIMQEPPPFKGFGEKVALALLQAGADPNDRSEGRNSIIFEAKGEKERKILSQYRGQLDSPEKILDAIDQKDFKTLETYLKSPGINVYRDGSTATTPLTRALTKMYSHHEIFVPLDQVQSPEMKVVATLLKFTPKIIHWTESGKNKDAIGSNAVIDWALHLNLWNVIEYYLSSKNELTEESKKLLLDSYLMIQFSQTPPPPPPMPGDFNCGDQNKESKNQFTEAQVKLFEAEIRKISKKEDLKISDRVESYIQYPTMKPLYFLESLDPKPKYAPYLSQIMERSDFLSMTDSKQRLSFLLKLGADPNVSYGERYPVQLAYLKKDLEALKILVKHGAKLNLPKPETFGCPPLAMAIAKDDIAMAKSLIKLGASLDAVYNAEIIDCNSNHPSPPWERRVGQLNNEHQIRMEKISNMKMSKKMSAELRK